MQIFREIAPLRSFLRAMRGPDKTIGLVPTMGFLHEGHLSLIRASLKSNHTTVCSIFVNPTQFNSREDYDQYPKSAEEDIEKLERAAVQVLFCPATEVMYGEEETVKIDPGRLNTEMEGRYRPGHFSGVATVVTKLFNIIEPDHAYFGQKDWQQLVIIRQLVREFKFNVTVHGLPTVRDPDGLAVSSRNARLAPGERALAPIFHAALLDARTVLLRGGSLPAARRAVTQKIKTAQGVRLEYFEAADRENLMLLNDVKKPERTVLCIAGYVGGIRLIDNMFL